MNPKFDIENYHKVFRKFPRCLWESEGKIYGCFVIGNDYTNSSRFHGAYPRKYLERMFALFPNKEKILHLFSGQLDISSKNEITFDINPMNVPDVVGNAEEIENFFDKKSFDLVLSDPPYTDNDCIIYGCKMPNKLKVMRSLFNVVKPGGILVWLDIRRPQYRKEEWKSLGYISIVRSTNHYVRTAILFERI